MSEDFTEAVADARSRIAYNVRRLRRERGWTQTELARRAQLNRNTTHALERERNMTLDAICRVAVALEVDWSELGAGTTEMEAWER